jgi:hypothetical protein
MIKITILNPFLIKCRFSFNENRFFYCILHVKILFLNFDVELIAKDNKINGR